MSAAHNTMTDDRRGLHGGATRGRRVFAFGYYGVENSGVNRFILVVGGFGRREFA